MLKGAQKDIFMQRKNNKKQKNDTARKEQVGEAVRKLHEARLIVGSRLRI